MTGAPELKSFRSGGKSLLRKVQAEVVAELLVEKLNQTCFREG